MMFYIHQFASFLRVHLTSISVGLVATLLILYGSYINDYFKRITKSLPFVVRFALFVVLCSVGYAFASSQLVRLLRFGLRQLSDFPLIGVVIGSFVLLAFLAKREKEI
jgi:Protein of unknown function (DUF3392).